MTGRDKIQYLLISYLMHHGSISLKLPDGVNLEIGITQEGKHGQIKSQDYCWVITSREDKSVALDSYNLGLNFIGENRIIMVDDEEDEFELPDLSEGIA